MAWEDRPYYRDEPPRVKVSVPMPTPMTMVIMGVCLVMFIAVNVLRNYRILEALELTFINGQAFKQPWRWLTYAYLHGSGRHIFWNLLTLYFFLPPLERAWGWKKAFAFYTLGTVMAGITFGIMCIFYPFMGLVGASGGVLAAMGACAYLFPEMTFFLIVPIRLAVALFAILYILTISGDKDASDAAHLGGLVFGFFAPYYGRKAFSGFTQRWEKKRQGAEVNDERKEQETIDGILAKVHEKGMNSLSWGEKRALKKATERQRQREVARARRAR